MIENNTQAAEKSAAFFRYALGVEYKGTRYSGWQIQTNPHRLTVQETLENALAKVADAPVRTICAGRTDAGVHALGQVVHFECENSRPDIAWIRGTNSHLPHNIRVRWATQVPTDFHARFSATARRYRYYFYNSPTPSAVGAKMLTWVPTLLDHDSMHCAAQALLGEQDFSSFRGAGCASKTPMRNVHQISVVRYEKLVVLEIQANAFLLHMVRNIAGALVQVGMGRQPTDWIKELIDAKDRTLSAATAAPDGLYLVDVVYPDNYHLPKPPLGPAYLLFA